MPQSNAMTAGLAQAAPPRSTAAENNRMNAEDRPVHDWYRFVLSYPPHLVRDYLERFDATSSSTLLDPFCGTGTTLVECKKLGIGSVGIEPNPIASFASGVKTNWSVDAESLGRWSDEVASQAERCLASSRPALSEAQVAEVSHPGQLGLAAKPRRGEPLRQLPAEQASLLLKNSVSPLPLHRSLVLLDCIDSHGPAPLQHLGRLALAKALVQEIGNLKFGPEVGVGKLKGDAPVVAAWLQGVRTMARDLRIHREGAGVPSEVIHADAREADRVVEHGSIDAVITSPPYPNEKDYTRTTRLESVLLGLITTREQLRRCKRNLVRSNTRGVYRGDTDHLAVEDNDAVNDIADAIEKRRIELGKTSGFERQYARVTRLYFGGMAEHLRSLRPLLKPGAKLAYVVGDQASYLRVMIRTGQLLAEIATSLGYRHIATDLFRTRPATATRTQLREEVVLLEWPGGGAPWGRGQPALAPHGTVPYRR